MLALVFGTDLTSVSLFDFSTAGSGLEMAALLDSDGGAHI